MKISSVNLKWARPGQWVARGTCILAATVFLAVLVPGRGADALDLFSDEPALDDGFVRVGSWNLRHINLEDGADGFLPGSTREQDFEILTATFAKAITDLRLDLLAVVEHQPRSGQPDRLLQVRDHLNNNTGTTWGVDQTAIPYDNPGGQFSGLQLGLLWNPSKITIDTNADKLLSELRQPRDAAGNLTERTMRIPWLVPVKAGHLEFDLLVVHLKSGGEAPQAAEVDALQRFITTRQSTSTARHLIFCGDWNIRPDQAEGRARLQKLRATVQGNALMRILTVESMGLTLSEWEALGSVGANTPIAKLLPASHYNDAFLDTLLDHLAISKTLSEVFDHPIQVTLADGKTDLRPGISIPTPLIAEADYRKLTDHLPVVLTLRTSTASPGPTPASELQIVSALPNPAGDDVQDEEVHVRNPGGGNISLTNWKITDAGGTQFWNLTASDGSVGTGTKTIKRNGRPMSLNNDGDTIVLISPSGAVVDRKSYGNAGSGVVIHF